MCVVVYLCHCKHADRADILRLRQHQPLAWTRLKCKPECSRIGYIWDFRVDSYCSVGFTYYVFPSCLVGSSLICLQGGGMPSNTGSVWEMSLFVWTVVKRSGTCPSALSNLTLFCLILFWLKVTDCVLRWCLFSLICLEGWIWFFFCDFQFSVRW